MGPLVYALHAGPDHSITPGYPDCARTAGAGGNMGKRSARRTGPSPRSGLAAILLVAALAALQDDGIRAQSVKSVQGEWKILLEKMPINPVHIALLHTGRV